MNTEVTMDEQSLQKKEINEKLQRVRGTRIFADFLAQVNDSITLTVTLALAVTDTGIRFHQTGTLSLSLFSTKFDHNKSRFLLKFDTC